MGLGRVLMRVTRSVFGPAWVEPAAPGSEADESGLRGGDSKPGGFGKGCKSGETEKA